MPGKDLTLSVKQTQGNGSLGTQFSSKIQVKPEKLETCSTLKASIIIIQSELGFTPG